jgi:hypothetical protein
MTGGRQDEQHDEQAQDDVCGSPAATVTTRSAERFIG